MCSRPITYCVVQRRFCPPWDPSRGLREQEGWDEHAAFMDGLVDDGFVVLGGPLDDGPRVLLVCAAADEETIRQRLAADPWAESGMLEVESVERWTILLDGRGGGGPGGPRARGSP